MGDLTEPGGPTLRRRGLRPGWHQVSESHASYSRPVAYQSLYRKYRPQRFAELVGQDHVSTALRNAVRDGRVGHAYLFSGPRGTGKTTTARLLAKALNCTNRGDDGDPCGECESCVAIADGTSLDVIEVDAASRSKVDEMRDLLERVAYLSAGGAKKVYILDEVHMLSGSAEAALLKTLEEAPEHVVFVLATTDPLKVAPTIRSRTQHFEFTLYTIDELSAHLADVCAKEGIEADPEALAVIARAGAGSMRDSLSLLDQAIAHGAIDLEQIERAVRRERVRGRLAILRAVADEDVAGALVALGEQLDAGHEPRRLTEDLLATVRDTFLLTSARGRVRVDVPDDAVEALAALGDQVGAPMLVRMLETLGQAVVDMRGTDAADPRLVLEIALVRLARREAGTPLQALAERIDRLERGAAPAAAPVRRAPAPPRAGVRAESAPRGLGPQRALVRRAQARPRAPRCRRRSPNRQQTRNLTRRRARTGGARGRAGGRGRHRRRDPGVGRHPAGAAAGDACRGARGTTDRGRRRRHHLRRAARALRRRGAALQEGSRQHPRRALRSPRP